MSCKKAIGGATEMKEKYGEKLELRIFRTDAKEAEPYQFQSSTNVLFNNEHVHIDIATDKINFKAPVRSFLCKGCIKRPIADTDKAHSVSWAQTECDGL